MKDSLEELENSLGEQLQKLPDVKPENVFKEDLRNRLLAEHTKTAQQKRTTGLNKITRYGSLAAALAVILAGWLVLFNPADKNNSSTVGPLFIAQAQASNILPQITLGSGVDSLRQVKFIMPEAVPEADKQGNVFKLKRGTITIEQAENLAGRLNIANPKVEDGSNIPENRHIYLTGENADLIVWPYQGSWQYFRHQDNSPGGDNLTPPAMKNAALDWLKAAGCMPQEEYTLTQTMLENGSEIVLRLKTAPDGSTLTGFVPEIKVTTAADAQITQASSTWYSSDETTKMELIDYKEALEALKRGEGSFDARNYRHYTPGTAKVKEIKTAYQLAYAIDFSPYLVPVAVFSGEYKPQGEPADQFTAVVPLLKVKTWPNSGNFVLNTNLPDAPSRIPLVIERGIEATKEEIPELATFFNIKGKPQEDGSIKNSAGEITPTSWDGGWLYRINGQIQNHESERISEAKALETAVKLVKRIPVLPGVPGKPVVRDDGSGFTLVVFPLLYNGVGITSNNPPGYESFISVQVGPQGDVWSVNCFRPMLPGSDNKTLLSPEEAWKQLLANKAQIHVEGFFGSMPGDRFVAASSSITRVELAYIPRHPELMRNENYDPVYLFVGKAQLGEQQVSFTAYVNALKEQE